MNPKAFYSKLLAICALVTLRAVSLVAEHGDYRPVILAVVPDLSANPKQLVITGEDLGESAPVVTLDALVHRGHSISSRQSKTWLHPTDSIAAELTGQSAKTPHSARRT